MCALWAQMTPPRVGRRHVICRLVCCAPQPPRKCADKVHKCQHEPSRSNVSTQAGARQELKITCSNFALTYRDSRQQIEFNEDLKTKMMMIIIIIITISSIRSCVAISTAPPDTTKSYIFRPLVIYWPGDNFCTLDSSHHHNHLCCHRHHRRRRCHFRHLPL